MESKKKKYVVLGLGVTGRAVLHYLHARGESLVGVDDHLVLDEELKVLARDGVVFEREITSEKLSDDLVLVKSPGICDTHPLVQLMNTHQIPILGEMELVANELVKRRCIGVTGTNGKTTVVSLIAHILNQAGVFAKACGNNGISLSSTLLEDRESVLIIELSSYQLESMKTPVLDEGVLLNITPDHLDRYRNFEEYKKAKFRIISLLKKSGNVFLHHKIEGGESPAVQFFSKKDAAFLQLEETYSQHELENIAAASGICLKVGLSIKQIRKGVLSFQKLPHRIEFVCKQNGVSYYNDSKGTNIDAVIAAVNSMKGPVTLLAGGVDKGSSYKPWIKTFSGKVKMICAIGEAASKIENQMKDKIPTRIFPSLEAAVVFATSKANAGESILLSPGCASFDMFRNYLERGETFKRIVHSLSLGESYESS